MKYVRSSKKLKHETVRSLKYQEDHREISESNFLISLLARNLEFHLLFSSEMKIFKFWSLNGWSWVDWQILEENHRSFAGPLRYCLIPSTSWINPSDQEIFSLLLFSRVETEYLNMVNIINCCEANMEFPDKQLKQDTVNCFFWLLCLQLGKQNP